MLDVWILTYFSNCADNSSGSSRVKHNDHQKKNPAEQVIDEAVEETVKVKKEKDSKGLFDRIIEKVPDGNILLHFRLLFSVLCFYRILYL